MGYTHDIVIEMTPKAYELLLDEMRKTKATDPQAIESIIQSGYITKCGVSRPEDVAHICLCFDCVRWDPSCMLYSQFLTNYMHKVRDLDNEDYGVHFLRIGEEWDDTEDDEFGCIGWCQVNIYRNINYEYEPAMTNMSICL